MSDLPKVPPMLSLEGRAILIADVAGQLHESAEARRHAIERVALAHLQIVHALALAHPAHVPGE